MIRRRAFVAALPAAACWSAARALPPASIAIPRDHGAHPDLRTEWWYITGRATAGSREFGFQVTFFRSRVDEARTLQSNFAARQLVFAHAAVTDVQGGRLWHDQRIARAGFGVAEARTGGLDVRLRDWTLVQQPGTGTIAARLPAGDFSLLLDFTPTQPPLLQGEAGLSRKGPDPAQASYYYSLPHLRTAGTLLLRGQRFAMDGLAWMDHEWSEALLHPDAVGWDWTGMNLDDGSALTAFRLRRADGSTLWDGGSFRPPGGPVRAFSSGGTAFAPLRHWTSGRSGARYPVAWSLRTPVGDFTLEPVLDDQELDSRGSTGAIYWEGLSRLLDARGRRVGWGYLEMTGYAQRLRL